MNSLIKVIFVSLSFLLQINICAADSGGQFIKDKKNGCLVWCDFYSSSVSVSWDGGCKDSYADGMGKLIWFDGNDTTAFFTGNLKKGNPNGQGKYVYLGWGIVEGEFIDGVLQGQGKIHMDNGGKLEGNFVDGNLLELDAEYLDKLQKIDLGIKDSIGIYWSNVPGSLFYYALPTGEQPKAVLVLMPSTGESAENVISCNKSLMQKCYDNDILTVVIASNYNKSLESDPAALNFFNTAFNDIVTKYNAPADKFILSGLSLGGENALQYTIMSRNPNYYTDIKPLAAIGVDPPVDMANLYRKAENEIELYENSDLEMTSGKQLALNEDKFLIDYFRELYGGSPGEFPERYIEGSQFSLDQMDGGNAKYLIDVPVRIYTDPDIVWMLENRNRDYYHMNCADLSAMINFLRLKGNTKAELVPALGKGYRLDGTRHPHSWSIMDADDCINWIMSLII